MLWSQTVPGQANSWCQHTNASSVLNAHTKGGDWSQQSPVLRVGSNHEHYLYLLELSSEFHLSSQKAVI